MNAAARDRLGDTPGGDDLITNALRKGLRRQADPPVGDGGDASTDVPADAGVSADAGGIADPRVDAPVDARVREETDQGQGAAQSAVEARTEPEGAQEVAQAATGLQGPSQGPRRMLEVKARAYRGGLAKLAPRAEALAAAARDVLNAGGTAAEVRGLLAEVGIPADEIPRQVREALKRRSP